MAFAGAASEAVSLSTSKGGMFLQGAEVKLPAASWTIGYHWVTEVNRYVLYPSVALG